MAILLINMQGSIGTCPRSIQTALKCEIDEINQYVAIIGVIKLFSITIIIMRTQHSHYFLTQHTELHMLRFCSVLEFFHIFDMCRISVEKIMSSNTSI